MLLVAATRYTVSLTGSMTGVPVMPTSVPSAVQFTSVVGIDVIYSWESRKLLCHNT